LLHLDLPHRHQSLPGSSAETECAQGRWSGGGGRVGRRIQPVGAVRGCALGSESGTRFDAPGTGAEDRSGLVGTNAPRADGFRVEALSRAEIAHGGRDAEYDGGDGEEYVVSRDAKVARRAGGDAMSLELVTRGARAVRIRACLQACRKCCFMRAPSGAVAGERSFTTASVPAKGYEKIGRAHV